MHFVSVARKAALMTMLLILMEGGGGHFVRCEEEAAAHPRLVPPTHSSKDALPSFSANVVKREQQHLRERVSSIEEEAVSLKVADQQLGEIDTGEDPFFTSVVENAREYISTAFKEIPKVISYIESNALALEARSTKEGHRDVKTDNDEGIVDHHIVTIHRRLSVVEEDVLADDFTANKSSSSSGRQSSSGGSNQGGSRRRFQSGARSSFHEYITTKHPKYAHHFKLQDAIVNGNHAHLERVFDTLKAKVDRHAGRVHHGAAAGRDLAEITKRSQCRLLWDCVRGMSVYDRFVSLRPAELNVTFDIACHGD
jgi:hypothetical protein